MSCSYQARYILLHGHFRDDNKINDIPAEENMAYSNLSIKKNLSDKVSMTNILFERNSSYSSYNVQNTLYDDVIQERQYDRVDAQPSKQLVLIKI